jgi:hypothetical protein
VSRILLVHCLRVRSMKVEQTNESGTFLAGALKAVAASDGTDNESQHDAHDGRDDAEKREDDGGERDSDDRKEEPRKIPPAAVRRTSNHSHKSKQQSRFPHPKKSSVMSRAPFPGPMSRGPPPPPYAPPPYGYPGSSGPYGHPPPPHYHPHHHPHMQHHMQPHMQQHMQPYSGQPYPGPPPGMNGRGHSNYHPHHHYAPPPYSGMAPYHHPMPPSYSMNSSDSVSSKGSKNSKKKRTIDGVHETGMALPHIAYTFRRTESTSSSTSTVTAGNNTSSETQRTDDSPHKRDRSNDLPALNMDGMVFDDHETVPSRQRPRYHHRDFSADASTASSLSVGGLSMSSYDGARGTFLGMPVL